MRACQGTALRRKYRAAEGHSRRQEPQETWKSFDAALLCIAPANIVKDFGGEKPLIQRFAVQRFAIGEILSDEASASRAS
jgi:hypothetical protein